MAGLTNPPFFRPRHGHKYLIGKASAGLLNFLAASQKSPSAQNWTLAVLLMQIIVIVGLVFSTVVTPAFISETDVFLLSTIVTILSFSIGGLTPGLISTIAFSFTIGAFYHPFSFSRPATLSNLRFVLFLIEGLLLACVFFFKERRRQQTLTIIGEEAQSRSQAQVNAEHWAFFDRVNQAMSEVTTYEERLHKLANLTVPAICDWCVIHMVSNHEITKTVIAHTNQDKLKWAQSLQNKYPPSLANTHYGIGRVIKTGKSELRSVVDSSMINQYIKNSAHRKILKELNIKSTIITPLISRGQIIGAISFVSTQSSRNYDNADLKFIEHFATRAAVSIDNARLYSEATTQLDKRRQAEDNLRKSQRQLEVIFENVDEGITVQDPTGKIILASRAAAKLIGFSSTKDLLVTPLEQIMQRFTIYDEKGRLLQPGDLPGRLALRGKNVPEKVVRFKINNTGEERWSLLRSTPVLNSAKKVQFVINLFRDITDRKLSDQKKDDFIAIVSHELKTPLTSVRGFSELSLKRAKDLKDQILIDYLSNIVTQSDRSFRLIKDLLDVARLQLGKLPLQKEKISLGKVVEDVVKSFKTLEEKHPIEVKGNFRGMVYADRIRLIQVLSNLVSNSIRYSTPGKKIIIAGRKTNDFITVMVEDFGKGISPTDQKDIFNRYYQGSRGDSQKGLGLGLFISKEIIRRHQGRIWVESVKDKGSQFYIRLPLYK